MLIDMVSLSLSLFRKLRFRASFSCSYCVVEAGTGREQYSLRYGDECYYFLAVLAWKEKEPFFPLLASSVVSPFPPEGKMRRFTRFRNPRRDGEVDRQRFLLVFSSSSDMI